MNTENIPQNRLIGQSVLDWSRYAKQWLRAAQAQAMRQGHRLSHFIPDPDASRFMDSQCCRCCASARIDRATGAVSGAAYERECPGKVVRR